ncbi:MAG: hypothetical protein O3A89_09725, partial [Actinomycetota bacterium]|nr:hypothetical protein [Actinomycetota bacterium]
MRRRSGGAVVRRCIVGGLLSSALGLERCDPRSSVVLRGHVVVFLQSVGLDQSSSRSSSSSWSWS